MSTNRRRGVINVVSGLTAPHESNYLPDGAIGPLLPHDVLLWRGEGQKLLAEVEMVPRGGHPPSL